MVKQEQGPDQYSCVSETLTLSPAWCCSLDMDRGLSLTSLPQSKFADKLVPSQLLYLYLLNCSPDEHVNLFQLSAKPELLASNLSCPFLIPSAKNPTT